ncbi:MAG: IS21 family transposase [Candidatus Auribacterota bacterium]|nr:IS21 family transposase [Candidatus Auribacterota bacterium]
MNKEKTLAIAASKAGMDEETARKYIKLDRLPSQVKTEHTWRTREDKFEGVWEELKEYLKPNPGLESKTLFDYLQGKYPGKFTDGQLRTLQRKVKIWRALEGPEKEIYFAQKHYAGDLSESDFTSMNDLGVTIQGERFEHLIYHFVLTYSNWESGTICFSENFESLSAGLQNALWELGGVPERHRTDKLSAAVHKECNPDEFTARYRGLLKHYGLRGESIGTAKPNENGDVEVSHRWYKNAIDQALMLRGSREFESRDAYKGFIKKIFKQRNMNRVQRFEEELKKLRRLPESRLDDCKRLKLTVGSGSTINVAHKIYSVNSRLRGETVDVKLYAEKVEVWYGQKKAESIPRIRGRHHNIQYRHVIKWLMRKPGAFENYRYKDDLFPTTRFRMAYDYLKARKPAGANKEYLKILYLAAKETEVGVDEALTRLFDAEEIVSAEAVKSIVGSKETIVTKKDVYVAETNLADYDKFIAGWGASARGGEV